MNSVADTIGRHLLSRSWRCTLILVAVGARLPALQGNLIWDDRLLVEGNPMIRSPLLIVEAFRHYLFPGAYSGHYRPVQTVSYMFDYLLWNSDTFGYHLSNIAFHVGSALALYFLLERLLTRLLADRQAAGCVAFLIALLWVVHPVHSAAVDYISGRADSLAFLFACGSWLLYLRARSTDLLALRWSGFGSALVCALLALCSRESGFMWMLVFLAHLFGFEKEISKRAKIAALTACVTVAAAYFGLRCLPESRPDDLALPSWSLSMRAVLMLRALGDYTRLLLFPTHLHVERSVLGPLQMFDWLAAGGVITCAALVYGAFRCGPGQQVRRFGACWLFLTYLPISNLFTLNATVAEHWLYLPSVGFLIFLAGLVLELPPRLRRIAPTFAGMVVLALAACSAMRSSDWVDPETFFRRTFAAGGSNSRIGVNLAVVYAEQGEHAKAEEILRKVLQVSPDFALARSNLALALTQQGKSEEAESLFRQAVTRSVGRETAHPATPDAALHLAQVLYQEEDTAAALAILTEAERAFPETWELVQLKARIRYETNRFEASHLLVQSYARKNWWHYGAAVAVARNCVERRELYQAELALRRASWLDVHDAEALNMLAAVKMRENQVPEALEAQKRALARQPNEPKQYFLLASMLESTGRPTEAREALAQLASLRSAAEGALAKAKSR